MRSAGRGISGCRFRCWKHSITWWQASIASGAAARARVRTVGGTRSGARHLEEVMSVDPDRPGRSGGTLADAGYLLERIAHAVAPASPTLGRVAAAISIARLGARLLPAGARVLRRHPVGSLLVVAGVLGAVYLLRPLPLSPRHRLG